MLNKNLSNKPFSSKTNRELHEIKKRGDLSQDELIAVDNELAARDLNLAKHEKQTKFNSYDFRWWHLALAMILIRAIFKIVNS